VPRALKEYGLLKPDIILSHATGSTEEELQILQESGAFISTTPATESQMAHGEIIGFRKDVRGSIGADCMCRFQLVCWRKSTDYAWNRPF
jgi:cytosine/adenosine deaminase-related metal-dependent hydrolase